MDVCFKKFFTSRNSTAAWRNKKGQQWHLVQVASFYSIKQYVGAFPPPRESLRGLSKHAELIEIQLSRSCLAEFSCWRKLLHIFPFTFILCLRIVLHANLSHCRLSWNILATLTANNCKQNFQLLVQLLKVVKNVFDRCSHNHPRSHERRGGRLWPDCSCWCVELN